MEERIIALRIRQSDQYHRQVGSRTIAAYLKREGSSENGIAPPSSTTIWRVLHRRQYILGEQRSDRQPLVRPEPGIHWEIDFCTVARQSPEAPQKKENALEVSSVIDRGSSANIDSQASTQFDAEEALRSLAATFQQQGLPRGGRQLDYPEFLGFMCDEARSEWQIHLWQQRLKASTRFSAAQSQTAN